MPAPLHLCTETLQHQKRRLRGGQGLVQGHTASSLPHAWMFEGGSSEGHLGQHSSKKSSIGVAALCFGANSFSLAPSWVGASQGSSNGCHLCFGGTILKEPVVPPGSRTSPCGSGALMWFSLASHSAPRGGEGSPKSPEARRGKRQGCKQIQGRLCRVVDDVCWAEVQMSEKGTEVTFESGITCRATAPQKVELV